MRTVYGGEYVSFEILVNGDLAIIPDLDTLQELKECDRFMNQSIAGQLWDLTKDIMCNSSFEWVLPEWIGALTEAPIIGYDGVYNDDDELEGYDRVWWLPDYCIRNEVEDLLEGKVVVFTRAE